MVKYKGLSMDHNRYKHYKRRSQYGSTDGFIAPASRQRNAPQISLHDSPQVTIKKHESLTAPVIQQPTPDSNIVQINDIESSFLQNAVPVETPTPQPYQGQASYTPRFHRKKSKKKVFLRSVLTCLLVLCLIGGYIGYRGLHTVNSVFHGNIISDATAAFNETPLKGETNGRVNILLAGDSVDDPDHGGATLTDSILLLSIDTQKHTAFLLSIPRDLWVYIPRLSSYQKINTANTVTNFNAAGYPSGGMGELEQVVQTQLGIPIDYYGLMDYGAFKDSVDAVGGVTITIQSPDPRGLYDPYTNLKLPNGPVTLTGQQALNLARARGDGPGAYGFPDSDFDRTAHQRQLFLAVSAKAKSLGVLANPVRISDLFNALGNNFQTDLNFQNVLRLIQITKNINLNDIQSYAFSSTISSTSANPILKNYIDPASGEEALIPSSGIGDFGQLQQYYQQLISNNPVVKETPSVVVLNASNVNGLASQQRTTLESKGYNVTAIADANSEYPTTMIVDNTQGKKPNSLKQLEQLYQGTVVSGDTGSAQANEAGNYTADFVVILGQNWQANP